MAKGEPKNMVMPPTDRKEEDGEAVVRLTKRQIEVLCLVIKGKTSKDVADALYVSKRTVDFHLTHIYDKLQVTNRVEAFRRATELGLIPLETSSLGNPLAVAA